MHHGLLAPSTGLTCDPVSEDSRTPRTCDALACLPSRYLVVTGEGGRKMQNWKHLLYTAAALAMVALAAGARYKP
jgi:hypothetical protein